MFIKDHVYLNKTLNSLWSKRLFTQSDVYFTSTSNTSNLSCLDISIDGWIDGWIGPYPNDKLTFGSKAAQNKDWKENIKWITWNVFIFSFHRYYRFYRYEITTNVSLCTHKVQCVLTFVQENVSTGSLGLITTANCGLICGNQFTNSLWPFLSQHFLYLLINQTQCRDKVKTPGIYRSRRMWAKRLRLWKEKRRRCTVFETGGIQYTNR